MTLGTVTLHHRSEPRLQVRAHHTGTGPRDRPPTARLGFELRWRRRALTSSYKGHHVEVIATYLTVAIGRRKWAIRFVNELRDEVSK